MRHEICPGCKEDIRFNTEEYCPYCGAIVTLTPRETVSQQLNLYYEQAKAAMQLGEWREAIKKLIAILYLDPEYKDAAALLSQNRLEQELFSYDRRARRYCELLEWDKARQCYRRILQLRPGDEDAAAGLRQVDQLQLANKRAKKKGGLLPEGRTIWLYLLGFVLLIIALILTAGVILLAVNLLT